MLRKLWLNLMHHCTTRIKPRALHPGPINYSHISTTTVGACDRNLFFLNIFHLNMYRNDDCSCRLSNEFQLSICTFWSTEYLSYHLCFFRLTLIDSLSWREYVEERALVARRGHSLLHDILTLFFIYNCWYYPFSLSVCSLLFWIPLFWALWLTARVPQAELAGGKGDLLATRAPCHAVLAFDLNLLHLMLFYYHTSSIFQFLVQLMLFILSSISVCLDLVCFQIFGRILRHWL